MSCKNNSSLPEGTRETTDSPPADSTKTPDVTSELNDVEGPPAKVEDEVSGENTNCVSFNLCICRTMFCSALLFFAAC